MGRLSPSVVWISALAIDNTAEEVTHFSMEVFEREQGLMVLVGHSANLKREPPPEYSTCSFSCTPDLLRQSTNACISSWAERGMSSPN